jgi:hypothetical protein
MNSRFSWFLGSKFGRKENTVLIFGSVQKGKVMEVKSLHRSSKDEDGCLLGCSAV